MKNHLTIYPNVSKTERKLHVPKLLIKIISVRRITLSTVILKLFNLVNEVGHLKHKMFCSLPEMFRIKTKKKTMQLINSSKINFQCTAEYYLYLCSFQLDFFRIPLSFFFKVCMTSGYQTLLHFP